MSLRTTNLESIPDRIVQLERQVQKLTSMLNSAWRVQGYVLYKDNTGLYVRNLTGPVDTFIAPP